MSCKGHFITGQSRRRKRINGKLVTIREAEPGDYVTIQDCPWCDVLEKKPE